MERRKRTDLAVRREKGPDLSRGDRRRNVTAAQGSPDAGSRGRRLPAGRSGGVLPSPYWCGGSLESGVWTGRKG
jgi:hypothetical protein